MKNLLPPIAGALLVLVIAMGAFLFRQSRAIDVLRERVEAERATFAQNYADLRNAQQVHEREMREADDAIVQARDRELRDATSTIAQLQRELTVARAAAGLEADREANAADPAVLEFRRRQERRIVQERYGDLFDRLSLSTESLEELKRLLIELEKPASAPTAPGTAGAAQTPRGSAAIHDEIYNLLGYEDYMTFDRYGRELMSVRPLVRRFANDAADARIPLTAVQRTALSRVIFEVTDPQTNADAVKPGANLANPATGLTPLDEQVLARASDVLSQPQLELLKAFRIQEREGLAAWRNSLAPAETTTPAASP